MGRPLAKRFFGNRNIGSTGTGDNKIGGEGIARIDWSDLGSFTGNGSVAPITVPALPAPTLPGGVQATWTMLFEVYSVSTGAGKTNLAVGDTFGVASIPGMIAKVTSTSGTNAVFSVSTSGASVGNALALADVPQDTQGITLTKIAGSGTADTFLCDIAFHIKLSTISITEKGSGYTGTETFTFTKAGTTSGNVPAGTIVLTTDTGDVGSSTNQENAIVAYAYVTGNSRVADIQAQKGSHRYLVKTSEGTAVCKLVAATPSAVGEMSITATDSAGKTYYVTKLTSHKALVTQYGSAGHQFATGTSVRWTFDAATADTTVKIANA